MVLKNSWFTHKEKVKLKSLDCVENKSFHPKKAYVDFIIINGNLEHNIRCDREAVTNNSIKLTELIIKTESDPNLNKVPCFEVQNVEKEDFETMVKFFEKKSLKYNDHKQVLRLLQLAESFDCYDFGTFCINELDLILNLSNVFDIYSYLYFYKDYLYNMQIRIANEITSNNNLLRLSFKPEEHGSKLLYNVLQFIDMHAEKILNDPKINDLSYEQIQLIAKRDALKINSEIALLKCLYFWSCKECQRRKLDVNNDNRLRVLGPLCLEPRYLLMSSNEFFTACRFLKPFEDIEIKLLQRIINGKKVNGLTSQQVALFNKFRTPRPKYTILPIHLSGRSKPENYNRKMRSESKNISKDDDGFFDKCILCFLSAVMCLLRS